jgi:glutamate racemase
MTQAPEKIDCRLHNPIGVFDSGVGGLSVLRALRAELQFERFVYLSDAGHAPYGEREDMHVIARSHAVTRYLVNQHYIKAMVVACNTATAAAIKVLRQDFPSLPIIGIEPALKPAAGLSQTKVVGVMATRGTLNSEKFKNLLDSLNGEVRFILQACDGLADAIEQADATKIIATCAQHTSAMGIFGKEPKAIDTLVLGCTHYPFSSEILRKMVGTEVTFLEGGAPVAKQTRRILLERQSLNTSKTTNSTHEPVVDFITTGNPETLQGAVNRWLHLNPWVQVQQINSD